MARKRRESQERELLTDRECLKTIRDLIVIKNFTYNSFVLEGLDNAIWGLLIDQLKKEEN